MSFPRPRDYLHMPLSDEHYHAIGHVAAMWSALEAQIQWLIWGLMGVKSETGALFTSAQRLDTQLIILRILGEARHLAGDAASELAFVISETKRLQDRRNTVIHTQWNFGDTPDSAQTYKIRLRDQRAGEQFTAEAIDAIALEINSLLRRTLDLYPKLYHASRDIQPQPLLKG